MKERMNPSARRAALQTEQDAEWNPSSTGAARRGAARTGSAQLGAAQRGARKRPSWRLVGGNSSLVLVPIDHRSNHLLSGMRGECTVFARPPLALFLRLSSFPALPLRFFLSSRLFPLTRAAFINPEPTVHASGSDDTANICPPILRRSQAEWKRSLPFVNVDSRDGN